MKRIATAITIIAAAAAALSAQTATDTITIVNTTSNVLVTRTGNATTVTLTDPATNAVTYRYQYDNGADADIAPDSLFIGTDDWESRLPFMKPVRDYFRNRTTGFNGTYIGAVIPQGNVGGITSMEAAISQAIKFTHTTAPLGPRLGIGAGVGCRLMHIGDGHMLGFERGRLSVNPVLPEQGITRYSSMISEFNLHVPLSISQPLTRNGRLLLTVGADAVFNIYSTASTSYEASGSRFSESYRGLHQRVLRAELWGEIGFSFVAVYFRYCPTPMFQKAWGPDYRSISMGLTFNFNLVD